MNKKVLKLAEEAAVEQRAGLRSATGTSFAARPGYFKLTGPGRLVRLIQVGKTTREGEELKGNRIDGQFWIEERVFLSVRSEAQRELASQSATAPQPFVVPMRSLVALYMKHSLRSDLAISKDWTPDFDRYVTLSLGSNDSLIALVGPIKNQPYYSQADPRHELGEKAGVSLIGNADQYVIDFNLPENRPFVGRIMGPTPF
jgi:hypothetical protein